MKPSEAIKKLLAKLLPDAKSSEPYVIGTQLAQAHAAEQRHDAARNLQPSPLIGLGYSSIEASLWRWTDAPVDDVIRAKIAEFAGLAPAARGVWRDSLTMDDFYTLLTFIRRSALAALRSGDSGKLEPAFIALAMIELARIDWRDLLVANWMAQYAGQRLGAPVQELLNRTLEIAEPNTQRALRSEQPARIDLAQSCGYQEVQSAQGIALFETHLERFEPTTDLTGIAFKCALALEDSGYVIDGIKMATDLPLVWLDGTDDPAIAGIVDRIAGCVSIDGIPAGDAEPMTSGQSLLVFITETASGSDAQIVADAASKASDEQVTQFGLASDRLCAVIIQRSWMADTTPLESITSLERLRSIFERLLTQ